MTNRSRTLYTGVSNDLLRRVYEHKDKLIDGFTKRYNMTRLVYFEQTADVYAAREREKQIKGWLRRKKIELVQAENPRWRDLAREWYGPARARDPSLHSGKQEADPHLTEWEA